MAITVYPAGAPQDNWVEIATTTPTSGSVVSFTSIDPSWRKLWVTTQGKKMTLASNGYLYIQVNSITATDSYIYYNQSSTQTIITDEIGIYSYAAAVAPNPTFNVVLTNKTSGTPFATFDGQASNGGATAINIWAGLIPSLTSAITQIDITTTVTFSGSNATALILYGTY